MLGCPSPKKSFKSSDNAHHIVGDPGEVSCVVRKDAESFQARVPDHFRTVRRMLAPDYAQKMLCITVPNRRTAKTIVRCFRVF